MDDILERLGRWVQDPIGLIVSRGPNDLRAPFQQDMFAALAEITELTRRAQVDAVNGWLQGDRVMAETERNAEHMRRVIAGVILPGCDAPMGDAAAGTIIAALCAAGYAAWFRNMGAVSDLPAEDQARLDKAYATEDRRR